ncbi:MAG: NHL repeat-containing protein [Acidobacteriia bacterium]|nr:NHL repeat-containing protein [Terriglobia bacterium]
MRKANLFSARNGFLLSLLAAPLLLQLVSCGKRADPAPKPPPPPPFQFLSAWGDKGDGPGKFGAPSAFATDSLGSVFFADPGAGFIDKFEAKGTPLLSFEDSRVRHATGIAVDSGGAIYLAEADRGSIFIFFPDGTFLRAMQSAPQRHFSGPLGITVDNQGNLFVPDPAGSRVAKFNDRGRLVKYLPAPADAAPDEKPSWVAASLDGSVFVAYFATGRIAKYSADGLFMTFWIAADNPAAQSHPIAGLAVGDGYVFTMSSVPPQIRVWTLDGQHKLDADLSEHLGEIAAPQIAVTPHSELLVFDPAAARIFWFRMNLNSKEQP